MSASRRKYTTEFRLLLTVHIDWICRPQELDQLAVVDFERSPHLYFLASHPRMSVDASEIIVDDSEIRGRIRRQLGADHDYFDFRLPHTFGSGVTFSTVWPHEVFKLHSNEGVDLGGGVVANLGIASTPEKSMKALDF